MRRLSLSASATGISHVLNDQDGRLVLVRDDDSDHAQRPVAAERDRIPVRQFVTVLCIVGGSAGVVLRDTGVRITRGFKSAFRQLVVRGDKFLPYESIVAVQFHKVPLGFGRAFGYIQLSLRGGGEA
jgi:hypothetical protein